jgi:transposase
MFGPGGGRQLDGLELAEPYTLRIESLRDLVPVYDREILMLERKIHQRLSGDKGYEAIQELNGVGRTIAAIFCAEIGDVHRFRSAPALCSWAGLTPRHHESDTKVVRGAITKMGSRLVRWAALEAVARYHGGSWLHEDFCRIAERRGKKKARVAVARKLLTLVYYGLRDGEIRALRDRQAA